MLVPDIRFLIIYISSQIINQSMQILGSRECGEEKLTQRMGEAVVHCSRKYVGESSQLLDVSEALKLRCVNEIPARKKQVKSWKNTKTR